MEAAIKGSSENRIVLGVSRVEISLVLLLVEVQAPLLG